MSAAEMLAQRRSSLRLTTREENAAKNSGGGGAGGPPTVHQIASVRSRNPRLEGYLWKKTKGIKGIRHFQKRWVVLYPDSCVIAYYRKRKDADKEFHVRNNMGVTVMPWAAAGIIPIDLITSVFPTSKGQRFDISVSRAAGKNRGKTYQWKCADQRQRDLWVEAIALVHHELQKRQQPSIVDEIESGEDEATAVADALDRLGDKATSEDDTGLPLRRVSSILGEGDVNTGITTDATSQRNGSGTTSNRSSTSTYRLRPLGNQMRKHSNMSSGSARSLVAVTSDMQGSEVLEKLLTTDRFAPLRPPPTSSKLSQAPTIAESVGRSLIGAEHMPNSGDSAMEDSDSSDDYDTDETDPEDVRDYIREMQQEATHAANNAPVLVERGRGHKGADTQTPIPVHVRSNTLMIDTERVDRDARKRALLIGIEESDSLEASMRPRALEIKVGWLHKMGRINKSWRRRFFVITHGQLRYYTSPTRQELKGTMDLVNIRVVGIDADVFRPPSEFCIEISHSISDRRLVLACGSIEEQEQWRRSIQRGGIQSVKELPPGLAMAESGSSRSAFTQSSARQQHGDLGGDSGGSRSTGINLLNLHLSDLNTKRVLENADWAGFITKCGRINKTWNTRLFVLKGSLLTYFEAEQKIIKIVARKGAVSMAGARVERVLRDDGSMGIDIFTGELDGRVRRLMLKFSSVGSAGMGNWVEKLKHAAQRFAIVTTDDGHTRVQKLPSLLNGSAVTDYASTGAGASDQKQSERDISASGAAHENCSSCHVDFATTSIFGVQGRTKSYQCPACGLRFCKECTMHRLPLPEITGKSDVVRVCDSCYDIESRRLIETQAAAKRRREEYERTVKRREIMEGLHWWYQDTETGAQQGPFDSARMRSWFDGGYFSLTLALWFGAHKDGRYAFRRRPMTIAEIFPGADNTGADAVFALAHPLAVEEANWVESTDPASEMTYYYNLVTEVSAWELPTVSGDHAAKQDAEQKNEMDEQSGPAAGPDNGAVFQYVYVRSHSWYYKDTGGAQQGPFHADEMRAWMDAGYFTSALYARLGNSGPFKLLQNLYSDLSLAFTRPPSATAAGTVVTGDMSAATAEIADGSVSSITSVASMSSAKSLKSTRNRSMSASVAETAKSTVTIPYQHLRNRSRTSHLRTETMGDLRTVIRKGFLKKRGRLNTNFKRRFFILDEISLSYYTKEGGKKKGQMMISGVRIEKYETRLNSTGTDEFCLDIIAKDRRLMLKAASMEDQVRWAVSIEKVSHASQLVATVVPLPSSDRPNAQKPSIEIATRGRGSSLAAPSVSMLQQNFSAIKVSSAPRPSTSLAKYRQWTSSQGSHESRGEHVGSPLSDPGLGAESKREPERISDNIVVKAMSAGTRGTRALRKTLRNLDRGQCDVDQALMKAYKYSVDKSEEEHSMLLNVIGSDDHPDLVKLNIFTRLDELALDGIVKSMFKIPTYPGMQLVREGDAGELFYCIGQGTYDVRVGGETGAGSRRRSQDLRHNVARQRARSRASSLARVRLESGNSQNSTDTFCTRLGPGSCFGEGALLSATRPASVICSTEKSGAGLAETESGGTRGVTLDSPGGWVWALSRDAYSTAVRKYEQRMKRERLAFLKSVPLFSGGTLSGKDFARLSDALEMREWEAGQTIVFQGSMKKKMFIVKSGLVSAVEDGDGQSWSAGETFGNRALLYEEKWDASIVAVQDTICLVLERKEFNRLLGGLKERILKTWSKERRRSLCAMDMEELAVDQERESTTRMPAAQAEAKNHKPGTMREEKLAEEVDGSPFETRGTLHASERDRPTSLRKVAMSESTTVMLAPLDVDDQGDDSDDSVEDDDGDMDDESDDDYADQDIEWEDGSMLDNDIAYADLEPRALLGAGSFGEVKLVLHKPSQRHYALKCMRRFFIVDNGFESMVENEKSAMCELAGSSLFLVNLYNTFQDKINIYMLMELCTGGELYDHLSKQEGKCVPMGTAQFYTACILQGLDAMHSRNIIYRDLKPENVMLDEGGYCKIVDFGLAKKTRRTYTVCGTPEYMAPEVVLSRGHDAGVDHWALGCMMYEMIAGYTPFVGGDQMEIYEHIIAHEKRDDLLFEASGFKYNGRARNLLKRLLHPKKTKRLGTLVNGADGIRNHSFFAESKRLHKFDWDSLNQMQIDPPFTPAPADFNALTTFDELDQEDEVDPDDVDRSGWSPTF